MSALRVSAFGFVAPIWLFFCANPSYTVDIEPKQR